MAKFTHVSQMEAAKRRKSQTAESGVQHTVLSIPGVYYAATRSEGASAEYRKKGIEKRVEKRTSKHIESDRSGSAGQCAL